MAAPAMSPGSCAPVSARFPIPLHRESPAGVWVQLPAEGTLLKPLMQAMPFPRPCPRKDHILDDNVDDGPVLSPELVRPKGITKAQVQGRSKRNTAHMTTNAPRLIAENWWSVPMSCCAMTSTGLSWTGRIDQALAVATMSALAFGLNRA